ncbi:ketoacyl-ACP synthase III [Mycolicibacterium boenickei]|uniref:Ketoacyl-ACP synthase III n=2 Tax=Mycolicibacterium boenickei TaxID=146017 RepID=A0AAX2ZV23_9MYCO|nr:ketoacyl-ACP synthase III [Mycolicibacterium boenickei]PEG56724.1 ketoacyl-ACP synthase III [Mycolicibacterium boenickei]UNB99154.1 ketoacyl-ACP synthase III [Mycolicibacterium boenickei]
MSAAMDREVRVAGIGVHIPPSRQPNLPLLPGFGVDEEFMQRRIGVTTRAIKAPDQKTSDLCIQAFNDLARKVPGLDTDAIEMICLVTQNPDSRIPHTSAVIHQSLNLPASCMTFDISQGCAGFPHALAVATSLAERFAFDNALIFTCDPYSTIVDPSDRDTALLFGDAATVTFLDRAGPGFRLVDAAFGTRPGSAAVLRYEGRLVMEGREVFLNAAREVPRAIRRLLECHHLREGDIDLFLLHPGSKYLLDVLRGDLGVGEDRLPFEAGEYGNTVSSSIPLMLASRLDAEQSAMRILLSGFGVGFSWGTCLLERIRG